MELCRLEQEEEDFFTRIDQGYQFLSKEEPKRIFTIKAERNMEEVEAEVASHFSNFLKG